MNDIMTETDALRAIYVAQITGKSPTTDSATIKELVQAGLVDESQGALTAKGRAKIRVTLSGGVFDIIHPGHIHTLEQAKGLGDVLVVVVATDTTAVKMKKRKPLHTQVQRQSLVRSLVMVDACVIGDEQDMFNTVKRISPDMIALGYDQAHQESYVTDGCKRVNIDARVVRLGATDPQMSSGAIEKAYGDMIHGI